MLQWEAVPGRDGLIQDKLCKPASVRSQPINTDKCLGAQTMDPRDEDKFDFDPLDVTKIWPEHLFPLQPVGRMVLNKVRPGPSLLHVNGKSS